MVGGGADVRSAPMEAAMAKFMLRLMLCFVLASSCSPVASVAQTSIDPVQDGARPDHDRRLKRLFELLKSADNEDDARRHALQIWTLWYQSGNDDVDLVMRQARRSTRGGDLTIALQLVERALKMMPRYSEAWNLRATILFYLGRDAESVADIERTLALEPRHFGALAGMMMINMRLGNWTGALRALRAGLKIHPFLQERKVLKRLEGLARGQPL